MIEDTIKPVKEQKDPAPDAQKSEENPPVAAVQITEKQTEENKTAPHADKPKRKRKPMTRFEIGTLILGGIGILVAGATGLAIYRQDKIASDTLGELKKQYPQLKQSADAATLAANTAASALKDSQTSFSQTLDQMKAQTKAQQKAVDVALDSLETSQKALLVVDIKGVDFSGKNVSFNVTNAGHLRPQDVQIIVHEQTVSRPLGNPDKDPMPSEELHWTKDSLPSYTATSIGFTVRIPKADEDRIASRQQKVFIVGVITYHDGFQRHGIQKAYFCWAFGTRWNPDIRDSAPKAVIWEPCDWTKELPVSEQTDEYPSEKHHARN